MTFRTAVLTAAKRTKLSAKTAAKLERLQAEAPVKHKRFWAVAEHVVANKYERQTGKKVKDWQQILDWLVANLPAILQLLITILPLFL